MNLANLSLNLGDWFLSLASRSLNLGLIMANEVHRPSNYTGMQHPSLGRDDGDDTTKFRMALVSSQTLNSDQESRA